MNSGEYSRRLRLAEASRKALTRPCISLSRKFPFDSDEPYPKRISLDTHPNGSGASRSSSDRGLPLLLSSGKPPPVAGSEADSAVVRAGKLPFIAGNDADAAAARPLSSCAGTPGVPGKPVGRPPDGGINVLSGA